MRDPAGVVLALTTGISSSMCFVLAGYKSHSASVGEVIFSICMGIVLAAMTYRVNYLRGRYDERWKVRS